MSLTSPADLLRLLRPSHWIKNLFVFVPLIYALAFFDTSASFLAFAAFVAFSLLSSTIYVFNDIQDRLADAEHPEKKRRPIASGRVSVAHAYLLGGFLLLLASAVAALLPVAAIGGLALYLLLNLGYSLGLKHVVILDIFIIAAGFMLRVVVGAAAISVPISSWLVICTLFLALFLAIAKRRREIANVGAGVSRKVLDDYTPELVRTIMIVSLCGAILTYTLYTMSPQTVTRFGTENLVFTVPIVLFGLFRYLYIDETRKRGENPVGLILRDPSLMIAGIVWITTSMVIIYADQV